MGGFATPAEGSFEGEPTVPTQVAAPASPTTAGVAIARHTVGFVSPPVAPSPRPSRLELPIPDLEATSSLSSEPIDMQTSRVVKELAAFSTAPPKAASRLKGEVAPYVAISHHEKIDYAKNDAQPRDATPAALKAFPPKFEAYRSASKHLYHLDRWGYAYAIHDDVGVYRSTQIAHDIHCQESLRDQGSLAHSERCEGI